MKKCIVVLLVTVASLATQKTQARLQIFDKVYQRDSISPSVVGKLKNILEKYGHDTILAGWQEKPGVSGVVFPGVKRVAYFSCIHKEWKGGRLENQFTIVHLDSGYVVQLRLNTLVGSPDTITPARKDKRFFPRTFTVSFSDQESEGYKMFYGNDCFWRIERPSPYRLIKEIRTFNSAVAQSETVSTELMDEEEGKYLKWYASKHGWANTVLDDSMKLYP